MALATASPARMTRPLARLPHGWLDAMPHPALACEIAADHIAVARGWHSAWETLPEGAVLPSPVELNLPDPQALRGPMQAALNRIGAAGPSVALLLPDQAIRVFLLHFETFPRRADEVIPFLRWRLKKSLPFEIEEAVVSHMMQPLAPNQASGVAVLAAVARQKVVRQYEEAAEALGLKAGVVLSSSLAALSLLPSDRAILLARVSGRTLTTVIVRGGALCVYRCSDIAPALATVDCGSVLEEAYPAVAFFQDTWRENVSEIRLAGFGARFDEFRRAIETELGTHTVPLLSNTMPGIPAVGRAMLDRQLDALAGWALKGAS